MRVVNFSSAMVVLMAAKSQCFQVATPRSVTKVSSSFQSSSSSPSALQLSAYEEQLKAYYGNSPTTHTQPVNGDAAVNGDAPSVNGAVVDGVPVNGVYTTTSSPPQTTSSLLTQSSVEYMNEQRKQQAMPVVSPPPPPPVPEQPAASSAITTTPPAPPVPVQQPQASSVMTTTAPQTSEQSGDVIEVTNNSPSLPTAGVLFLGLPLWLLLSVQVFGNSIGTNTLPTQTQPVPIMQTNEITLPARVAGVPNDANTAGVVVLSQPITKAEVRDLFNLWNDALQTLDPATVAKRYGKEGVLLPTLSDVPRNDFEGIKDYFVGFLKKKPVGKILEGDVYIGNNWAQDAGKDIRLLLLYIYIISPLLVGVITLYN